MNVAPRVRVLALGSCLFSLLSANGATPAPPGGFFQGDDNAKPWPYYDRDQGANGVIYVYDAGLLGEVNCYYFYVVPAGKSIEDVVLALEDGRTHVCLTGGEKNLGFLTSEKFMIQCLGNSAAQHLGRYSSTTATPTPTPSSAHVSNDGDAFEISCDGRYAVVVGANSALPVSLVDLSTRMEVSTFTFNGLSQSVSVCDDSHSVLVQLDNVNQTAGQVRRLTINNATLADTNESLILGSATVFLRKVYAAPGSKTGIALIHGGGPSLLISFSIPGLMMIDSVNLAGQIGNGAVFNCQGTKVYARSGNRGINPDVVECFGYNPVTGLFTKPANLTISGVGPYTSTVYPEPIALTLDGSHLLVSEANPSAGAPTPRVTFFNTTTGARDGAITNASPVNPVNVDIPSCCSQRKQITSIIHPASGHTVLHGKVESPTWTFSLQFAPNMTTTFGSPVSLTSDANGMFQYDDAGAVGLTKRFYELTYP